MLLAAKAIDLLGALAWPGVIVVMLYMFRVKLNALLERLIAVGLPGGTHFGFAAPDQTSSEPGPIGDVGRSQLTSTDSNGDGAIPPVANPAFAGVIEEIEASIRQTLQRTTERFRFDREALLIRGLADCQATVALERIERVIWGSQINAIDTLQASGGRADISIFRAAYDTAVRTYPDAYRTYSFDQWLGFLRHVGLIVVSDSEVTTTELGKAFLPYITSRNYPIQRRF